MKAIHKWRNVLQVSDTQPTETTDAFFTTATTVAAPTTNLQGTDLKKRSRRVLLSYVTSGNAGAVTFRVWFHLPGAGWFLDDSLGAAGSVTVAAITDPQRALIVEYPGDRVYIEVTANAASTDLDMWCYEGIEED